mmetsp:Transcript_5003/g.9778  ORF Transcript_5003/g.9778 Transcript_5003/m.9778 type:complete len:257 (-) Transcript_5003:1418-2188(-)
MMLVHRSTVLAALLALSGTNCNAFSSSTHQNQNNNNRIIGTTTTQLHSTIPAPGSVTSSLTPPSSIDSTSTSDLFDTRVQKTYGRYPITFVSGSGSTLTDENGKTYLDFVSGIATCALGHNNPSLTKAVCDQMGKLHHVSNLYYTPGQGLLAAWLCENSCADKAFFCNSGAESNEAAIKLARKHANDRGITVSRLLEFSWSSIFQPRAFEMVMSILEEDTRGYRLMGRGRYYVSRISWKRVIILQGRMRKIEIDVG